MELQYLELLERVLNEGVVQSNRTGIDCITMPGAMLQCDLRDGFPLLTTKRVPFQSVVAELKGFLLGSNSAKDFRNLGTKIWDANANQNQVWLSNPNRTGEDDLGRIYGVQWRCWSKYIENPGYDPDTYEWTPVDQIQNALDLVRNNPESRRIVVTAWNPGELDEMALPPCHVMFQLIPHKSTGLLHMNMYQRSCDMFLGVPFNIASYALLLELFALWTGFKAGTLTMHLGDVHIYTNHIDQVKLQLSRIPYPDGRLICYAGYNKENLESLRTMTADELAKDLIGQSIFIADYKCHDAIPAPMAV